MRKSVTTFAHACGSLRRLRFGEVIGILKGGVDFLDGNTITSAVLVDKLPKPVPFVEVPASAIGEVLVGCKVVATLVVFKGATDDGSFENLGNFKLFSGFGQHSFQWKKGLQGGGQGIVFGFQSGTGNGSLQLGTPSVRHITQLYNPPRARPSRVGISIWFNFVKSTERRQHRDRD